MLIIYDNKACWGTLFSGIPGLCTPIPPTPSRLNPDTGLSLAPRFMVLQRLARAASIMFPIELVILGPALLVRGDTPDPGTICIMIKVTVLDTRARFKVDSKCRVHGCRFQQ